MSIFDADGLLGFDEEAYAAAECERAAALVRRAQQAIEDLGLPAVVSTDAAGIKITITAWRRVPDRDADRLVSMLEDLAEAQRRR